MKNDSLIKKETTVRESNFGDRDGSVEDPFLGNFTSYYSEFSIHNIYS